MGNNQVHDYVRANNLMETNVITITTNKYYLQAFELSHTTYSNRSLTTFFLFVQFQFLFLNLQNTSEFRNLI